MNNDDLFRPVTKDRRRFPALTEEEKAAILATHKVTRCPPVYVAVTFGQTLCRRNFG